MMPESKKINVKHAIAKAIKRSDTSYFFEDYNKQAVAVLSAIKQQGLKIVPDQPDDAMIDAGVNAIGTGNIRPQDHVRYVYLDMVSKVKL